MITMTKDMNETTSLELIWIRPVHYEDGLVARNDTITAAFLWGGAFTDMSFLQVSKTYGNGMKGKEIILFVCGDNRSVSRCP